MTQDDLYLAEHLLKKEFGGNWKEIVQHLGTQELTSCVGRNLTSFMAFPERKQGGSNRWRGNCSPEVVRAVLKHVLQCRAYEGKQNQDFVLLDPMSGSGTSGDVAAGEGVRSVLYDLNPKPAKGKGNWDALKDEVEECASMIFLHPPYHSIIPYSGSVWGEPHPDDLSHCSSYKDYIDKLNFIIKKLFISLRHGGYLVVLVGDIRTQGSFHSIGNDMMTIGTLVSWIVKGQYNCRSSSRTYSSKPFIPIVTEHLLLFKKEEWLLVPFSYRVSGICDLESNDSAALTWFHLVRGIMEKNGGTMSLKNLYEHLGQHPKAKKNQYYKERIRACIYEHRSQFQTDGKGTYRLAYAVE